MNPRDLTDKRLAEMVEFADLLGIEAADVRAEAARRAEVATRFAARPAQTPRERTGDEELEAAGYTGWRSLALFARPTVVKALVPFAATPCVIPKLHADQLQQDGYALPLAQDAPVDVRAGDYLLVGLDVAARYRDLGYVENAPAGAWPSIWREGRAPGRTFTVVRPASWGPDPLAASKAKAKGVVGAIVDAFNAGAKGTP